MHSSLENLPREFFIWTGGHFSDIYYSLVIPTVVNTSLGLIKYRDSIVIIFQLLPLSQVGFTDCLPFPCFQLIGHILEQPGQLDGVLPEHGATQTGQT